MGKFDTGACEVIECCKLGCLYVYMISANLPVSCARILDYEETEPRSRCPEIKTLKLVKSKVRSGMASSVLLASSQFGPLYVKGPETGFPVNAIHCFLLLLFAKRPSDANGRSF